MILWAEYALIFISTGILYYVISDIYFGSYRKRIIKSETKKLAEILNSYRNTNREGDITFSDVNDYKNQLNDYFDAIMINDFKITDEIFTVLRDFKKLEEFDPNKPVSSTP